MQQNPKTSLSRFLGGIVVVMLCGTYFSGVQAEGSKRYRYVHPYRYDYPDESHELRQDINRLRGQMNRQQRQLKEQLRLQRKQNQLLGQQTSARRRVSAMQACYYRFDAGLDLCEDLFDAASTDYAKCRKIVVEKNPSCSGEISNPDSNAKD